MGDEPSMRRLEAVLLALGLTLAATAADAACRWDWDCSSGYPCRHVQICDNANASPAITPPSAVDLPAIKPPGISPIPGSPIAPIPGSTIPPVGTSACRQAQMCDGSGNCRWETVCR